MVASNSPKILPGQCLKRPYLIAAVATVFALILAVAWFNAFQKMGWLTLIVTQLEEERRDALAARDEAIEALMPAVLKLREAEDVKRQFAQAASDVLRIRQEIEAVLNELAETQRARMSMGWQLSELGKRPERSDDRNRMMQEIAKCERRINKSILKAAKLHYEISARQADFVAADRELTDQLAGIRTTLETQLVDDQERRSFPINISARGKGDHRVTD